MDVKGQEVRMMVKTEQEVHQLIHMLPIIAERLLRYKTTGIRREIADRNLIITVFFLSFSFPFFFSFFLFKILTTRGNILSHFHSIKQVNYRLSRVRKLFRVPCPAIMHHASSLHGVNMLTIPSFM